MNLRSATTLIAAATLLSRATGMAREMAVAAWFGARSSTDAFVAAMILPDLLRDLLTGVVVTAIVVPAVSAALAANRREEATRLGAGILTVVSAGLLMASLLAWFLSPALARIVAPGFDPVRSAETATLIRWLAPGILITGMGGTLGLILNAHQRFTAPAFTPALMNAGIIGAGALFASTFGTRALAAGLVAGTMCQLLILGLIARGAGLTLRPIRPWAIPGFGRLLRGSVPLLGGLGASYATILFTRVLASTLPAGGLATLSFASKLYEFSMGVCGVSLATALLPALAARASTSRPEFAITAAAALRAVVLLTVPLAAAYAALGPSLIEALFQRGAFDRAATTATAVVLAGFAGAAVAGPAQYVAAQPFFALGDTATPVRVWLIGLAVQTGCSLWWVSSLGAAGLALAASAGAACHLALLVRRLRVRVPEMAWRRLAGDAAAALAAGVFAALAMAGAAACLPGAWVRVTVAGLIGAAVYVGALALWRGDLVRDGWEPLRRWVAART